MSLNADIQATEKLVVNTSVIYNKAEDSWDWSFVERQSLVLGGGAYDYNSWEQNNLIDSYSDLSYEQYQITAGGTYNFTDMLYANASFTYDIFNAGETYVYGDEDGTAYYGYVGLGWKF